MFPPPQPWKQLVAIDPDQEYLAFTSRFALRSFLRAFSRALQHGQSLKTFHRDMRSPSPFIRWHVRGQDLPLQWADALERIRQYDEQRKVTPAT